jgi:hypothetical protein
MRALFTLYLALLWLTVAYPYGLWLFVLSAVGFGRWSARSDYGGTAAKHLNSEKTRLG